jgi:hypothetical protein
MDDLFAGPARDDQVIEAPPSFRCHREGSARTIRRTSRESELLQTVGTKDERDLERCAHLPYSMSVPEADADEQDLGETKPSSLPLGSRFP